MERLQSSIEPLEYAYRLGMSCGEIQYAYISALQHCVVSYQCGVKLEMVERLMKMYSGEMVECKQCLSQSILQVWHQTVLNLMGLSDDPLKLSGDAMDQEPFLNDSLECKVGSPPFVVYHNCSLLAYLFGEYELAAKMAAKGEALVSKVQSFYADGNHTFVQGLISLALGRSTDQTNFQTIAKQSIDQMEIWSEYAPSNYQHKLLLLQAEYAFVFVKSDDAAVLYDEAIDKAAENGITQDLAIAYERAGLFNFAQGNASKASQLYGQAHDVYLQWGAR
eukprot:11812382-Ditylum_brightwellii.AAC.1